MHPAFLAAIADRPDDDLPRLVYADYLEENGDPDRAEFIRTQIELAKLHDYHLRRAALEQRERELLFAHKDAWTLPELHGLSQSFRRGFVELVNVSAEWLVAHPGRLLAAHGPLRAVRVFRASAYLTRLAEVPDFARFESLDLSNTNFAGRNDVRNFFNAAPLANLRKLVLRNSNFVEDEEVQALAETPVAHRLKSLDLSGNRLANPGLRAVAESPAFGELEVLTVRANELESYSCVHASGAGAVANSRTLTRLKSLDLSDHYIGDGGLTLLVSSPNAASLERLAVEYNEIGENADDGGTLAVVNSLRLANLRELCFGGNYLRAVGVEAIAAWPHLERMDFVSLVDCSLMDEERAILMRSVWAEKFVLS